MPKHRIHSSPSSPEVRGYQFFKSVSDQYPQRTIRIRTFLQIDISIQSVSVTIVFHVFKVRAWSRQTDCVVCCMFQRQWPRFYNLKFGRRLKCRSTWSACIHWKNQTLVFLKHAHFAVTTVLSNVLSDHFFQQNKLTITFNKMITSGKFDRSYLLCQPPKWAAC